MSRLTAVLPLSPGTPEGVDTIATVAHKTSLKYSVLPEGDKEAYRNSVEWKLLSKMYNTIRQQRDIHNDAAIYFSSWNFRLIFPSILITFASSVMAFTADYFGDENRAVMDISIAVLAALATSVQVLVGALNMQSKADQHRGAFEELSELSNLVRFALRGLLPDDFDGHVKAFIRSPSAFRRALFTQALEWGHGPSRTLNSSDRISAPL